MFGFGKEDSFKIADTLKSSGQVSVIYVAPYERIDKHSLLMDYTSLTIVDKNFP